MPSKTLVFVTAIAIALGVIGASVARNEVSFGQTTPLVPYPAPFPYPASLPNPIPPGGAAFPPSASYALTAGTSTLSAAYNYAPPVRNITVYPTPGSSVSRGFGSAFMGTYLGPQNQGIYFDTSYVPGPIGRWYLGNDPFHPQAPEQVELTNGQYKGTGPIPDGANGISWWHHAQQNSGSSVAEDGVTGEARMFNGLGITQNWGFDVAVTFDAGGAGGSFGQLLGPDVSPGNSNFAVTSRRVVGGNVSVADATANGNYFLYAASASAELVGGTPVSRVNIVNMTELSGGGIIGTFWQSGENLPLFGSIGWRGVDELEIIQVPGKPNHFLLGRSEASGSPVIHIAEINPDTGNTLRVNGIARQKATTLAAGLIADNIQAATVNGITYVFMNDNSSSSQSTWNTGLAAGILNPGDISIGIYRFDPVSLGLTRLGKMTLPMFPDATRRQWKLLSSLKGDAYPVLVTPYTSKTDKYSLKFFPLTKNILTATATVMRPAFTLSDPSDFHNPIQLGELLVGSWPFQGFLRNENGRTNLYFYRTAYIVSGVGDFFNIARIEAPLPADVNTNVYEPGYRISSIPTLRVDKIDVSSFAKTGTAASANTLPPKTDSTSTVAVSVGPAAPVDCNQNHSFLCDQLNQLRKLVCALSPASVFCIVKQ